MTMTLREMYDQACLVDDQEIADMVLEKMVDLMAEQVQPREEAERLVKDNLGYVAGYHSHEVRARVERLFRCEHPIFGSILRRGPPSPMQAMRMGMRWGLSLPGTFEKFQFPSGTFCYLQLDDYLDPIPTFTYKLTTTTASVTSTDYYRHIEEVQDDL
jgi:hypothetical protein